MHPWLGSWISPLVLAHVLAAFAFVLLHGPTVYAMLHLRRERDPARVGALLDMSRAASVASGIALALLGVSGALLAFTHHVWGEAWVWGSAVVLGVVSGAMSGLAARPFNEARIAVGAAWFNGRRLQPGTGVVDAAALPAALARIRARLPATMAIGAVGLVVLVWLMVERPA